MNIGIFTHNYPKTSKERKDAGIFVYDFAHQLKNKHNVYVFCPNYKGRKEKNIEVPVTWFKWGGNEKLGSWKITNPLNIFRFVKLIYFGQKEAIEFINKNKIDHVLCCWAIPSAIIANIATKKTRIPYSSWSLGSDINKFAKIPLLKQMIVFSLANAKTRYANSYDLVKKIKSITGIDSHFLPAVTNFPTESLGKKKKNKLTRFLYVGRLEAEKGPDVLIQAADILNNSKKKFVLNIIGDGSMRGDLQRDIDENLKGKVFIRGWASQNKVSDYMFSSDYLIIPSRSESFPLVLLEAARNSLKIIATDVGDCKKVINKYNIGVVVKKENSKALARVMSNVITDGLDISKESFRKLTKDISLENAVKQFEERLKI